MKIHRILVVLSLLPFALVVLAGCGRDNSEKIQVSFVQQPFLSAKDLEKGSMIPDRAYYSGGSKVAIVFRNKAKKKVLRTYDVSPPPSTEPFVQVYQTAPAEDIQNVAFAGDETFYSTFSKNTWTVFQGQEKNFEKLLTSPKPIDLVAMAGRYAIAAEVNGKYDISPDLPLKGQKIVSIGDVQISPSGKLFFSFLGKDDLGYSTWKVSSDGIESASYDYVSALSIAEGEKVAYLAKDTKGRWSTVVGSRKNLLQREFIEIGQVFEQGGQIIFSAMEAKRNSWSIYRGDTVLREKLPYGPKLFVGKSKIVYTEVTDDGVKYIRGTYESPLYGQTDEFIETPGGLLFAKIKNKFGLWQVVMGENVSPQYVWMSNVFLDESGNPFFFGVDSYGKMEYVKVKQ